MIRKVLLLLFFAMGSMAAFAQWDSQWQWDGKGDITPFMELCYDWREWPVPNRINEFIVDYILLDQNQENGQNYPVLGIYDTRGGGSIPGMAEGYYKAIDIRMDDGCIYVKRDEFIAMMEDDSPWHALADKNNMPYRQTADGELVLYDFNMQVGDKYLSVEGYPDISVTDVSTLLTRDGVERRLLTLSNGCQLLEGFGCLNSPGLFYFYLNPSAYMEEYCKNTKPTLRMITKGDDIVFSYDDNMGVEDINSKTSVFNPQTSTLFDLQGRRLTEAPAKGVFIQNGKKVTY